MSSVHHDLAGIDLNLLVALDALLAELHVTRAAARLGVTQSAASHALSRLRALFGDPLLVRSAGGAMLATPLATKIAPKIRRTLDDLASTLRGESFDPATAKRTFHIGASDYAEIALLPKLAARVEKLAPGVDLWLHDFPDWGDAELASGALDLVLCPPRGAARPAGTYERVLFEESFTCVMRAGHPMAGKRLTLARFCALSHVLIAPRGRPGGFVDDALAAQGLSRRVAVAVPHFLVVPHVVASTDLVATLATRVARLLAQSTGLVTQPPPVEVAPFQISSVWHERNQADAPHKWLREQVLAVATEIR